MACPETAGNRRPIHTDHAATTTAQPVGGLKPPLQQGENTGKLTGKAGANEHHPQIRRTKTPQGNLLVQVLDGLFQGGVTGHGGAPLTRL